MPSRKSFGARSSLAAAIALACAFAVIKGQPQGFSFFFLAPGYAQHLYGVTSSFLRTPPQKSYLGGVVVLQDGDVIAAECETNGTRLHRFEASVTIPGTTLHPESFMNTAGGCGIALHPDGFVYSNMNDGVNGVAKINLATGSATRMGLPGNALGIAVDPLTNHLVYAGATCKPGFVSPAPSTCTLFDLNPATGVTTPRAVLPTSQIAYVDGIAFDPSGAYIFLTNRYPPWTLVVLSRAGAVVRLVPMSSEPVGLGFHAASPRFVVTNNQDGTMTRFDFPGDNYAAAPAVSVFAAGGFRGDLMQAGPDGCLYLTQDGARYDTGENDSDPRTNSIVQVCDGFAPPPGVIPNPPPPPSSLCGFSYNDADNDGNKDAADAGIAGVAVTLTGVDNLGRTVGASATTAPDGAYCFNDLRAGTYTISEMQPPGYLDGKDTQGTPGSGTSGNDVFTGIVLAAGVDGRNNNFGELLASSLSGFVYLDTDNNGTKGANEAGIGGVSVMLAGTDDRGSAVTLSMSTGVDGAYLFAGLRPGTYTISETQPPSYGDGKDRQGTPGTGTTGNDVFSGIVLKQNVTGRDNNFGELIGVPGIALVKTTNGTDNNHPPGPMVPAGSTVTWAYLVTNTGNVPLSAVSVADDQIGAISCPATTLAVAASMTCTASGIALPGQHTNIGTASARDAAATLVTASDPDNYFGARPAVSLVKLTNGTDNDSGTGPTVEAGSRVTWTYIVSNTGNVALSDVAVTDDKVGAIKCPSKLPVGDSVTCTATGTAVTGQYVNVGSVNATDPTGQTVSAQNPDRYLGVVPTADLGISVAAPASVTAGGTFAYTVSAVNGGPSAASDVVVAHAVPTNIAFAAMSAPGGWKCTSPAPGQAGTISCRKPAMTKGETAVFSVTLSLACSYPGLGPVPLSATISSETLDPNPRNNTSTADVAIVKPALVISGATVDHPELWPPNHKLTDVRVDYTLTGGCGMSAAQVSVTSNESEDPSDWEIVDARRVRLRSERTGKAKEGRIYAIKILAIDSAGSTATKTVEVTVPHDQGKGK